MTAERLQKFLAGAGVASRRKAEELITSGRVKVNNAVVTELGTKVDPERDLVTVDGKTVSTPEGRTYVLLYKPPGCVTTVSDPQGRPTALDYLRGVKGRVFPVGRLDFDAEGAVLFTDDGELANRLAHPRYGHRRVYLVKVKGDPDPEQLERMRTGVRLEDGPAKALEVAVHEHAEKNVWLRLEVGEGRYHLVKRLCESVGLSVLRLFRPEFGGVSVEGLRPGQHRSLAAAEVKAMRQLVGLAPGAPAAPAPGRALPKAARRHGHGPPPPKGFTPSPPAHRAGAEGGDEEADRPRGAGRRSGAHAGTRPSADKGARPKPRAKPSRPRGGR
ncbi:MAG TPA: pseudouridine synthase [Anaeromyxobacteraceae bacterium]|nr:pseudouridine synthase [Anaeromyxobacteraceae bacterium]